MLHQLHFLFFHDKNNAKCIAVVIKIHSPFQIQVAQKEIQGLHYKCYFEIPNS